MSAPDRRVLAAVQAVLARERYASAEAVVEELGDKADLATTKQQMELLIDHGYIAGKTLTGDAQLLHVDATKVTEKGFDYLRETEPAMRVTKAAGFLADRVLVTLVVGVAVVVIGAVVLF